MWRDFEKIRSSRKKSFQRYTRKRWKSKFWMKLLLDRWWENGLVLKIPRSKIHQNFLASKYDIKQDYDAT